MNVEPKLFSLVTSYIGPIYVATPIVEEVDLIAIEPEIEDVFTAKDTEGRTSFQDNICFLTAKRQGFSCISNDKNLRKQCSDANVPNICGLELILNLASIKAIYKKEALRIARDIHKANPRHISLKILNQFEVKLNRS